MKKIAIILSTISFLFCSFKTLNVSDNKIRVVVIDAGHGGHDPGCHGSSAKEKDIALKVALKTGAMIKKKLPNVKIIYTRDRDVFVELHERSKIANRNGADLFISIHCNSATPAAYGIEVFTMGAHKAEDNVQLALRENAVIEKEKNYKENYQGYDPNSPFVRIIIENMQNNFSKQSLDFESQINTKFNTFVKKSRGVKQAGFLVLWETTMPSVLIELGFLTNYYEQKKLISSDYQYKLANGIADALSLIHI